MFTKRRQGGKVLTQHRRFFTYRLFQARERQVYESIGNANKETKPRYLAVNHNKIRDDQMWHHGFYVSLHYV